MNETVTPAPGIQPNAEKPDWIGGRAWAVAVAVALLAGLLRLGVADSRGFWLDEYYTLKAAQLPVAEMVRDRLDAGHSPLYFFYARLGPRLGTAEWRLRATSAAAVAATILLLTGLAGSLGLRRHLPALWSLALLQPFWITIGTEYRYMMPLVAVTTGCAWSAAVYNRRRTLRWGIPLMLLCAALLWLHGSAQFIALALIAFLWWDARAREGRWNRRVWLAPWPVVAGFVLSLPLLFMIRGHGSGTGTDMPSLSWAIKSLCQTVFGDDSLWTRFLNQTVFGDDSLWTRLLNLPKHLLLPFEIALLAVGIGLTRRMLMRVGRADAWRLLAALLLVIPVALMLFSALIRNYQGPIRYVAALSLPTTICLAVGWSELAAPRWRRGYRIALAALILVQASGSALDRGDRHREAIRWVIRCHSDREPIIVSTANINILAFEYQGFKQETLFTGISSFVRDEETAKPILLKVMDPAPRGFIFLYHDRAPIHELVEKFKKEGYLADFQAWKVSGKVTVIAWIRRPAEASWLASLPSPPKVWGPAHGDED